MSLLSFFLWIGTISVSFNSEGNLPLSYAKIENFAYKLSNQTFVQFNDIGWTIFLQVSLFKVEITDSLFNFITTSFSERECWIKRSSLDFDYTWVFVERFNYRHNRINIVTCQPKTLRFWYVQSGMFKVLGFGMLKVH